MSDAPRPPAAAPRGLVDQVVIGLLAAAFLGALWGCLETLARIVYYARFANPGLFVIPRYSFLDGVGAVVLSGLDYALVGVAIGVLAMLVIAPLLRIVTRRESEWCLFVAPRFSVIFIGLFFNLYWWSRWLFQFAYSERFYSPKRIALTVALALIALAVAVWVVRRVLAMPRMRGRTRMVGLAAVAVIGAVFLLRERSIIADVPGKADATGKYNVVFVIVDTLRADRLGCYGYSRPTSPRLDKIAAEGTVFENAFVQAPYTWTSFGSFFTGKYPRKHGLLKMDPTLFFEPKQNLTLQRILQDNGYRTSAFLTGMLSNASGLLDGFETYLESMVARDVVHRRSTWSFFRSELVLRMIATKVRQAVDPSYVADEAADWLVDNSDSRFFTLVHLYSTHTPYDPPKEHDIFSPGYRGSLHRFTNQHTELIHSGQWTPTPEDVQRINDLYDGGVHHADAMIGGLYEVLLRRGLLEETILVISADHGEELGERGLYEHNWMYNTNQRVPFLWRVPGGVGAGVRVDTPVESIDLLPTLLELLAIPLPTLPVGETIDGESLAPWFDGKRKKDDDFTFCENTIYLSVQNREWKLIKPYVASPDDPPRLYHLATDPNEFVNLHASAPPALAVLEREWTAFHERMPEIRLPTTGVSRSDVMDLLRENGYLGAQPREGIRAAQQAPAVGAPASSGKPSDG